MLRRRHTAGPVRWPHWPGLIRHGRNRFCGWCSIIGPEKADAGDVSPSRAYRSHHGRPTITQAVLQGLIAREPTGQGSRSKSRCCAAAMAHTDHAAGRVPRYRRGACSAGQRRGYHGTASGLWVRGPQVHCCWSRARRAVVRLVPGAQARTVTRRSSLRDQSRPRRATVAVGRDTCGTLQNQTGCMVGDPLAQGECAERAVSDV